MSENKQQANTGRYEQLIPNDREINIGEGSIEHQAGTTNYTKHEDVGIQGEGQSKEGVAAPGDIKDSGADESGVRVKAGGGQEGVQQ